jgi:type VI secretion system protein ImpI
MELVLTLEGGGGGAMGEAQRRVHGGRFSIGRTADNDWVLPDPERVLSKHHCLIEERGGEWLVTDTSSNGVYVGGSPAPLGQGRSAPLRDGARLRLGSYVLAVRVAAEPASSARAASPAAAAAAALARPDPGNELFDVSWFGGKPLDAPAHPARVDPAPPFTRPDHAPVDHVALDLPRRPSPFDEVVAPAAPARDPGKPMAPSRLLDADWDMSAAETYPPRPAADPAPRPAPPPEAVPPAPPPPPDAGPSAAGGDARQLLAAFLKGAGLPADDAGAEDPGRLLEELGRRYRMMAGGLVELLLVRAALKRETGLERTMVAATGNNPLKLTATPDEAVRWLVRPRGAGYLPPEPAIAAALDDLKAFTPELVQAMQRALRALLRRFDPAGLERELADASLLRILAAGGRKAQHWELFKERYAEIARQAEAEFLREVGVEGVRGPRRVLQENR